MNIVERKLEELEGKIGGRIIETGYALLAIFKKSLKFADKFLEPIRRAKIGEVAYKLLKERFGLFVDIVIRLAKEYANHARKIVARCKAEKFFDYISKAEPIKE